MPRLNRAMYGFSPMLGAQQVSLWSETPMSFNGSTSYTTDGDAWNTGGNQSHFDITNTYAGSVVARIKAVSIPESSVYVFSTSSARFAIGVDGTADAFFVTCTSDGDLTAQTTQELKLRSTNAAVVDSTWFTLMASWDGEGVTGGNYDNMQLYDHAGNSLLNTSVSEYVAGNKVLAYSRENTTPACTTCDMSIGGSTSGSAQWAGCISAVAFAPVYTDWSSSANRLKVCDTSGNLKNPGTGGVNWFGSEAALLVYDWDAGSETITNHSGTVFSPNSNDTFIMLTGGTEVVACT
jgi:hypothetical protein